MVDPTELREKIMTDEEVAMTNKERIKKYAQKIGIDNVIDMGMTVDLMSSEDYKDRFKAEYFQTSIRYYKLYRTLIKMEAGTLDFTPSCPKEILEDQLYYMNEYLRVLRIRAEVEGIDLAGF